MNYFPNFIEKDIEFLSNPELITILVSVFDEIDIVASSGAHRSTTYLSVSAIEGLFGEILKLKKLQPVGNNTTQGWPIDKKTGKPKLVTNLTLEERETILLKNNALPSDFENLYAPIRVFRNYMHPEREIKNQTPIAQSVAQLALAALNALIEKYKLQRFLAMQEWHLEYGLAKVLSDDVLHMPQNPGATPNASLLVTEQPSVNFRTMTFYVDIPDNAIFDFVYSYKSRDHFMAARIEGRDRGNGKGYDNGRMHCIKWGNWSVTAPYTTKTEPSANQRQHSIQVILDPPGNIAFIVDGTQLELKDSVDWGYDPQGRIGFMTEHGLVSVTDLKLETR